MTTFKFPALSTDRRPPPEFISPLPIRKTRAGLQVTLVAFLIIKNMPMMLDINNESKHCY